MTRLDRLTERLNLKEFQLRALLEVTRTINGNPGREELLHLFGHILREDLGVTRLMLFEHGEGWRCAHHFGAEPHQVQVDVRPIAERYSDIQYLGSTDTAGLEGFDIAVPVHHRDRALALLLIGDLDEEERRVSPAVKHLNFIQTITNLVAVALENRRLQKAALQQERDRRELELAAEMQGMLIPRALPDDAQVQAAAWYQPHRQVGGDYYDLFMAGPERMVICVADVSGKGMAAALLVSNFQATLRAMFGAEPPLERALPDLNKLVMDRARGERFITAFLAVADLGTGRMHYVNAGHNPPLLLRGTELTELRTGCIALGMLPELPFVSVGEARIDGASLLAFTDGLVEQEDGLGNGFGIERLQRMLTEFAPGGPSAVVETVKAAFEAHRAGEPYLDDIALLNCRFGQR
jgi:sigma-B regulation protein RsbU (phosphoserine phosphatase)